MPKLAGITPAPNITSVITDVDLVAYSKEIIFRAQPKLVWEQFCVKKTELNKQPGQTIQFLKFNDIAEGDELEEGTPMVVDDISTAHVQIKVKEWGKAVALTEYLLRISAYDLLDALSISMGQNYAKTSNLSFIRTIFQNTPNILYGKEKANRAALTPMDSFDTTILDLLAEDFATRNVPELEMPFVAGMSSAYAGVVSPHTAAQLARDPRFVEVKKYAAPQDMLTGEIGMYNNIRLVKTNFIPVIKHPGTYTPWGGGAPTTPATNVGHVFINGVNMTDRKPLMFPAQTIVPGQIIHQSAFTGMRGVGLAIALPVGLRHNGIIDFERQRQIAWYSIMGSGIINDDRLIIVETIGSK